MHRPIHWRNKTTTPQIYGTGNTGKPDDDAKYLLLPFFLTPRPLLQPQNKCGPLGIFPFPLISHSLLAFQGGTELTGAVVCAKAIWGSVRGHFDTYTAGAELNHQSSDHWTTVLPSAAPIVHVCTS